MTPTRRHLLAIAAAVPLASCGTILHPERKGQVDGRIDPSIAILNGIGLLLFLVPGVIAFAVDFSNGTIYLPGTQTSDASDDYSEYAFAGALTEGQLDETWHEHFNADKPFELEELQKLPLAETADIGPALTTVSARKYAAL